MEINLKVKKEEFFNNWLLYLNPILQLTETERSILAMYLFLVCLNSKADKIKVSQKVFSAKTRKLIRAKLNISEPSFNNYYSNLKKKKLIVEKEYGFDVAEKLKVDISKNGSLKINFNII
jgi:hypothetical protein